MAATLHLLARSPHSSFYTLRWSPGDIPPPTARFRRHALACGLYFLNSLTFAYFARQARLQLESLP
jgi:hypothetical protein